MDWASGICVISRLGIGLDRIQALKRSFWRWSGRRTKAINRRGNKIPSGPHKSVLRCIKNTPYSTLDSSLSIISKLEACFDWPSVGGDVECLWSRCFWSPYCRLIGHSNADIMISGCADSGKGIALACYRKDCPMPNEPVNNWDEAKMISHTAG